MRNGWVKLFRSLRDWEWFTDSHMVHFFVYLVISANIEDSTWRGIPVKRGQLITGLSSLSQATGISIRSIRTCIDRMIRTGEIVVKSTNAYSIITVCKYDDYQQSECDSDKPTTSKRQTNDKQTTTKKEEEEERRRKRKEECVVRFESFWNAYHSATGKPKEDKNGALAYWNRLTDDEQEKAIEMCLPYSKTNVSKYLKMARTYLENKSFNNEFTPLKDTGKQTIDYTEFNKHLAK